MIKVVTFGPFITRTMTELEKVFQEVIGFDVKFQIKKEREQLEFGWQSYD